MELLRHEPEKSPTLFPIKTFHSSERKAHVNSQKICAGTFISDLCICSWLLGPIIKVESIADTILLIQRRTTTTMNITKITSSDSKKFLEANKDTLVVLLFDAGFTGQKDLVNSAADALNESSDLKGKVALGIVDIEENNDLATELSILSVPMAACIMKGQITKKVDTLEPSKLVRIVKEELNRIASDSTTGQEVDPKQKFKNYLTSLVNRSPVMVFMKGDPAVPRCGFSRQLIELLKKHEIKYETFDILQDEDVRQGLKEYSDWPTYPQIYSKGEFVGGLDILKQLEEAGELEATLKV